MLNLYRKLAWRKARLSLLCSWYARCWGRTTDMPVALLIEMALRTETFWRRILQAFPPPKVQKVQLPTIVDPARTLSPPGQLVITSSRQLRGPNFAGSRLAHVSLRSPFTS